MEKIKITVIGLTFSHTQRGAYALILGEENGDKRLPIIIGGYEAQAIAIELEKMKPPRPLTHDLFKQFADVFNFNLNEVLISELKEGIFYSRIIGANYENKAVNIDARTSDAIAIALRFNIPIYTYKSIIDEAGVQMNQTLHTLEEFVDNADDDIQNTEKSDDDIIKNDLSLDDLNEMLNDAIRDEDYEKASTIRDEIQKKNKKKK